MATIQELQRGQLWPKGGFAIKDGKRVRRTVREYLCDLFTRGRHWFFGDDGGHTRIGLNGPVLARTCKLCGNRIQWGN